MSVHLGHLTVSNRTRYVVIEGGSDDWRGPSTWDAARDIATIWAATIGGFAATWIALTLLAECFT